MQQTSKTSKILSIIVMMSAATIFLYLFGVFVSFEWSVALWTGGSRMLFAGFWTMFLAFSISAAFTEKG